MQPTGESLTLVRLWLELWERDRVPVYIESESATGTRVIVGTVKRVGYAYTIEGKHSSGAPNYISLDLKTIEAVELDHSSAGMRLIMADCTQFYIRRY